MPGPRHHIYTYIISNYTKGPPVLPEGLSSQPVKDRPPTYVNSTTSSRTFLNCACASNQLWSCSFHRREGSSGFFRETAHLSAASQMRLFPAALYGER
jgi:hypothetical protein